MSERAATSGEALGGARGRSALLKTWAVEAGFHRAGVASLAPSENAAAFQQWLDLGRNAGMEYMARYQDRRLDPALLLDGARSALVVALHYAPLEENRVEDAPVQLREEPAAGRSPRADRLLDRVARYARGDDYHEVMKARLRSLGERIEEAFPGARSRAYVDTGPILERELAARAGLGAVGKNTNLLHRDGSWFLIGELLLTLELEPDQPLADMCGSCTRCLDACPTGAFPEPYVLDANRCISYWTIEHRGPIGEQDEMFVDDWGFGCDICQEVCPWNEFHDKRGAQVFDEAWARPPQERTEVTVEDLAGMERDQYVEVFRRSPMKRAKLEGLKRNAAIVLGRLRQPDE